MLRFALFPALVLLALTPNIAFGFGAFGFASSDPRFPNTDQRPAASSSVESMPRSAEDLFIRVAQRFTDRRLPKFENFPAQLYAGTVRPPNLKSHPEANTYRTRLRNAAKGTVSFAGEYAVATWGCGASCITGAIINAKTGNVIFFPGSICCWDRDEESIIDYKLDSRLMIFRGYINEQDPVATHYYVLGDNRFDLIFTKQSKTKLPRATNDASSSQTLSNPNRIASSGSDTDVTDYALVNDTSFDITIRWLDGQAREQPAYDPQGTTDDQWVFPGDVWQIANGAKTWESHWYAVFSRSGFVCSFSPRQGENLQFSQLDACNITNAAGEQDDDDFTAPKRLEDNVFAIGTYSSNSAPSGNIEMNPDTYALTWTEFCGPQIKLTADWSFGQLTTNHTNPQIFELDISDVGDVTGFQVGQHVYVKEDGIMMPGCIGNNESKAPRPKLTLPKPNDSYTKAPGPNLPKVNAPNPALPKINAPKLQQAPDARAQKNYDQVKPALYENCASSFPNSPADDKMFYDCMDQALSASTK